MTPPDQLPSKCPTCGSEKPGLCRMGNHVHHFPPHFFGSRRSDCCPDPFHDQLPPDSEQWECVGEDGPERLTFKNRTKVMGLRAWEGAARYEERAPRDAIDALIGAADDPAQRTCEVCGYLNTVKRWYYWGTCEECGSVKGEEKAGPLPTAGAWAKGEVTEAQPLISLACYSRTDDMHNECRVSGCECWCHRADSENRA